MIDHGPLSLGQLEPLSGEGQTNVDRETERTVQWNASWRTTGELDGERCVIPRHPCILFDYEYPSTGVTTWA